jgi:vancomycin aglycone glucosyltransferase
LIEGTVAAQFETIAAAARGRDIIVGATAIQIAAPSIAERMGIPYVFAAYCPIVLPSRHHAPPLLVSLGDKSPAPVADYSEHWVSDTERWNDAWRAPLNTQRTLLGLAPIDDVRSHVLTARPWLAADPTLGPWPEPADDRVLQTGAWILHDERPLAPEIEAFLDAGEPPVYFGFGSIGAPANLSRVMIESARALGRRSIVLRGWADLPLIDDASDCFSIGEVNQQTLFKRVAAVVHHGGAGTTTAAARAGAPQVVIPQHYDQPYWARRVQQLGVGTAHEGATPSAESLTAALERVLQPDVAARARAVAAEIRGDGARIAARAVLTTPGSMANASSRP